MAICRTIFQGKTQFSGVRSLTAAAVLMALPLSAATALVPVGATGAQSVGEAKQATQIPVTQSPADVFGASSARDVRGHFHAKSADRIVAAPATPAAPDSTQATKSSKSSTEALPKDVVGGYWKKWKSDNSVTLGDVDPRYNVVFLAFAESAGTDGTLAFEQYVQSNDSFRADLKKLQDRGTRVVLSIGGQSSRVHIDSEAKRQKVLNSLVGLVDKYGFDGIDWDIENQSIHVDNIVWVSNALKDRYGKGFAVTITPQGHIYELKEVAQKLGDNLDMISIMYYDYHEKDAESRTRAVVHRTQELIDKYGVKPSQIGVGMRVTDDSGKYYPDGPGQGFSLNGVKHTTNTMEQRYPDYRGVFLWTIQYDKRAGGHWLNTVAG